MNLRGPNMAHLNPECIERTTTPERFREPVTDLQQGGLQFGCKRAGIILRLPLLPG